MSSNKTNSSKMRNLEVTVTYKYQINVDDSNDLVKEYNDDKDLAEDLAHFRFSEVLPVVAVGAVKTTDIDVVEVVSVNPIS